MMMSENVVVSLVRTAGFVGKERAEVLEGEVSSFAAAQQLGGRDVPVHAKKGSTERREPRLPKRKLK